MAFGYWFGLVWFGLVWFGLVWFGLVWFGLVWWLQFIKKCHLPKSKSQKFQALTNSLPTIE